MLYGWKENSMLTNFLAACAHLPYVRQSDIFLKKILILSHPLHSTPPLGGFLSECRHPLWYGKTRRWKNFGDIFIRFDVIHERDRRTDRRTLHDSIDRACIASRGKNRPILMKFGTLHQKILNPISHVTKNCNFWNLRWRRPPSWKSLFWP